MLLKGRNDFTCSGLLKAGALFPQYQRGDRSIQSISGVVAGCPVLHKPPGYWFSGLTVHFQRDFANTQVGDCYGKKTVRDPTAPVEEEETHKILNPFGLKLL